MVMEITEEDKQKFREIVKEIYQPDVELIRRIQDLENRVERIDKELTNHIDDRESHSTRYK